MHAVTRLGLALALALAGLGIASSNAAGQFLPSPDASTLPARAVLVGLRFGTTPDSSLGHFVIVVRSRHSIAIPFSGVSCELEAGSDFRLASDQLDPRVTAHCGTHAVSTVSGGDGTAHFTILGGGRSPAGAPAAANRLIVHADGVRLGTIPLTCYDLNGTSGLELADVSAWGRDFFGNLDPVRADFDADGRVDLLDLSLWSALYLQGAYGGSPAAYCP